MIEYFAKLERVVRRFLAWLEDDCIATDQRRREFARNQEEWKVPGQDPGDHPDRLVKQKDIFLRTVAFNHIALDAAAPLSHIVDVIGGKIHFDPSQPQRLALLLGNYAGQRLHLRANFIG